MHDPEHRTPGRLVRGVTRREAMRAGLNVGLGAGLGAAAIGLARLAGVRGSSAFAGPLAPPSPGATWSGPTGHPILQLAESLDSVWIDGLPFAEGWTGDDFANDAFPFHSCENCFPDGGPPEPSEEVDVAVIGGGLSGLATADALRHRRVALFELRNRMGGTAAGERWRETSCSLGSAYFIVPDLGSDLEALYRRLGVWPGSAVAQGEVSVEIDGDLVMDLLQWDGFTPAEQAVVRRYAEVVRYFAEEAYPEIPLPRDRDVQWILDLDRSTLRADIEKRVGATLPKRLAEAIQAYCYSSFGVGWDQISAASGWNFIAAEEFGRIVLPGGNAGLASALWESVRHTERVQRRSILRPRRKVVDVRLDGDGVRVTWSDGLQFASVRARHAVLANAKSVAKYMLPELSELDPEKFEAVHQFTTCAYAVVNVLMEQSSAQRFYDLFLLGSSGGRGGFPMDAGSAEKALKVIDVLDGGYAAAGGGASTILTLYWPLPWGSARFALLGPEGWANFAAALVPQLRSILALLGLDTSSIHQIRMSRWGHAMPIARPDAIADGLPELLRRPIADRIWFVNQDNWLLPAVETCLLEAIDVSAQIESRLSNTT